MGFSDKTIGEGKGDPYRTNCQHQQSSVPLCLSSLTSIY